MIESVAFYIFAALTLICGLLVIANPFTRNPITSAMFLVLTIISMAGLFVQLHAFFLAAVQVLVYAGAVMVLFVFVIMLLDLKQEEQRQVKAAMAVLGLAAVGMIAYAMVRTVRSAQFASATNTPQFEGSTQVIGHSLFTQFSVPFEILSLLLLVAMMGTILLSKKEVK
jgi:NADH-quinone oxidoreductase subunit J